MFSKGCFVQILQNDLYDILQSSGISIGDFDLGIDYNHEPEIGDTVPESQLFRLDMSSQNIFLPQEMLAYQPKDEERYFYAEVSYVVSLLDSSGQPLKPMNLEYVIITSKDGSEKRVKAIDLFKFIRGKKSPEDTPRVESQELVLFQGDPSNLPPPPPTGSDSATAGPDSTHQSINVEQAKEEVREELRDILQLPKEDQQKALRRLYLRWHPDKNPHDSRSAEEVFKFIQQEIDSVERQEGLPTSSSQSWRQREHSWNYTARRHQHYQSQFQQDSAGMQTGHGRKRKRGQRNDGGARFFDMPFTPPKNVMEAKRWVSQAEADYIALRVLLDEARASIQLPCHACFMAHEVAEKALKGAMYATCGLREERRRSHNITPLARAIEQVEPEKARGISALALPLEPTYYLYTRFPMEGAAPSIPFEGFSLSHAEEAEKSANGILKIVSDIVNTPSSLTV